VSSICSLGTPTSALLLRLSLCFTSISAL
jgi:hypothetical protein